MERLQRYGYRETPTSVKFNKMVDAVNDNTEALENKQETIQDLEDIRRGATAGATAVQPSSLSPLTQQVSELSRQMGELSDAVEGKQDTIADLESIRSGAEAGATALQPVEGKGLSSNDYTDDDKQKVQDALTEHQKLKTINGESIAGEGNIVIKPKDGGYIKPSDGIPASDMTEAVRESLDKAETALQPEDIADWVKQPDKPSYTASEVGAMPDDTPIPTLPENIVTDPDYVHTDNNFTNEEKEKLANALTEHQSLAEYIKKDDADNDYQPKGNYLTEHQDISGKADKTVSVTSLPSDGVLIAGTSYKLGTIASLTIDGIPTSDAETTVYFTAADGFTMSIPDCEVIGELSAEAGKSYVMSILNGIVVMGEVTPYNN